MQTIAAVVDEVLTEMAAARDAPADAPPQSIVVESIEKMRFLVALEERLGVALDTLDVAQLFAAQARGDIVALVERLLATASPEHAR